MCVLCGRVAGQRQMCSLQYMCIMCFLVQNGTLTSQRLIHHVVIFMVSDATVCECVCVRKRKSVRMWKIHTQRERIKYRQCRVVHCEQCQVW